MFFNAMDAYARPSERRVGENRPLVEHHAPSPDRHVSHRQRQAEKEAVAATRRAIKKSARRHLQREMEAELDELPAPGQERPAP